MPSTILPISLTRDFSVKPANGLRYGNFEGVVYFPPPTKNEKRGEPNFSQLNNKQIYRKICDWFDVWRPWQQQHLLYGIADRCSITQLDILATTLEPVRHRDYTAAYKQRYPSTPFKILKQRQESRNYKLKFEEPEVQRPPKSNVTIDTPGQVYEFDVVGDRRIDLLEDILSSTESPDDSRQIETQDTFDLLCEEKANENPFQKYVTDLTSTIIEQAVSHAAVLHKYGTATEYKGGEDPVYHTPRSHPGGTSRISFTSTEIESTITEEDDEKRETVMSLRETNLSLIRETNISMRETDTSMRGLAKSQQYSRIRVLSPTIIETSKKYYREKSYSSVNSDMSKSLEHFTSRNTSRVRQHLFGSNAASTPDFFPTDTETIHRLGPMQRQIRFGDVHKPKGVQSIPFTLQKSYKNVKWWTGAPTKGKIFMKAKKSDLMSNYKDQLKQIWNWLTQWEGYEKINLLKEVLKLSGDEVLSQLTVHIQQRLRDTRDVNRLSDKILLYIFSFLSPRQIFKSSQVCRRWRYLCDTDDLWMIKCHELGVKEGIDNMDDIVLNSNKDMMGIDWKLAYMELQRITRIMKWDAKQRETYIPIPWQQFLPVLVTIPKTAHGAEIRAAEEAERLRKQKEEEGLPSDNIDFQDLLEKYCKLFHISPLAEVEIRRGTLSRLQRDEEKRQQKEITAAAAKAQKEKESKTIEEEEDDVSSEVSSEDLEEYMDSVFQVVSRENSRASAFWKKLKTYTTQTKIQDIERTQQQVRFRKEMKEREKKEKQEREEKKKNKTKAKDQPPEPMKKTEPEKKTDETAFDIRTDLIQATDILGKSRPSMRLEWRPIEEPDDKTPRPFEMPRYMGIVKSVKRVRRLQGHLNAILSTHFDKKRLISAGLDRTIRLWDIRSGKSIHKFYGHKGGIRCLQFEGNTLFTGSWDTTIIVWNLRTFDKITIMAKHTDCVSCLYIGPEYIVSGSYDKTVRVWSRQTYLQWKVIRGHTAAVNSLSCDGEYVVSGSSDMTLRLVNIQTSECLRVFKGCQDYILSVVMQGDLIISGDTAGRVYFWNRETGRTEAAIQAHEGQIHKVAFHKGRFFTASSDSTIREWDLMTMTSVRVLQGHKGPVRDIKVSDDRFVTCSEDGTIRIWDLFDSRRPGLKI